MRPIVAAAGRYGINAALASRDAGGRDVVGWDRSGALRVAGLMVREHHQTRPNLPRDVVFRTVAIISADFHDLGGQASCPEPGRR